MARPTVQLRAADGRSIALITGTASAVMGALVFLLRALELAPDTTLVPRITTGAMFALAGVGLVAAARTAPSARSPRQVCAGVVLAIALSCLIDRVASGHMSTMNDGGAISPLPTVIAFLLLGLALFSHGRAHPQVPYLSAAAVGVIVFTGVSGYALGLRPSDSVLAGMSPTSLVFLGLLSFGHLSLSPHLPPFSWIALDTTGARLARRLVPVMLLLPLGLAMLLPSWNTVTGLPDEAGLAVAVALLGTVLTAATAITVREVDGAELRAAHARREADAKVRASERRFRTLAVEMPSGMVVRDETGAITFANDEAYRIFGLEPGADLQAKAADMAHPDDFARALTAMRHTMATGEPYEQESRIILATGEVRWVHVRGTRQDDEHGDFLNYLSIIADVTDRRQAEQAERVANEQFRVSFDRAPVGMIDIGADGQVRRVNAAMLELLKSTQDEVLASAPFAYVHPDDLEAVAGLFARLGVESDTVSAAAQRLVDSAGREVWIEAHLSLVRDTAGNPEHTLVQVLDITERRDYERRLQQLAHHDPLTGLLNRRAFESRLGEHVAHVRRYGEVGALLMIDLDGFKGVNDTLGHAVGDALLVGVAGALNERLRETDVIARLGGDEFAVLLPGQSGEEAAKVGRCLLELIRRNAATLEGRAPGPVAASIGVADFAIGVQADDMLIRADLAMYAAKESGKNRVVVHDDAVAAAIRPRP